MEYTTEQIMSNLLNNGYHQTKDYKIKYVKADKSKGFNFGYLLLIPNDLEYHTMIIEGNNSRYKGTEEYYISEMLRHGEHPMTEAKAPIMVPLLDAWEEVKLYDENATREEELYPQSLSRNTMLIKDPNDPNYRVDLQIFNMFEDAKEIVESECNVELDDQAYLNGYSCSSDLALRLALIHPERVKGMSSGGNNGLRPLPIEKIGEHEANYPVGIADFEELFGKKFNEEAYRKIKTFYYRGEDENKKMVYRTKEDGSSDKYEDQYYNVANNRRLYDKKTGDLFHKILGFKVEEKEENNKQIYISLGYNTEYKTYPGGHTVSRKVNTAIRDINNHYRKCVGLEINSDYNK